MSATDKLASASRNGEAQAASIPAVDSKELFRGNRQVQILHAGQICHLVTGALGLVSDTVARALLSYFLPASVDHLMLRFLALLRGEGTIADHGDRAHQNRASEDGPHLPIDVSRKDHCSWHSGE